VQAYANAQGQLANARSLLGTVIMERYPQLASQERFADLMVQLEGTENSILVARRDYNEEVRQYNTTIRTFPDAIGAKVFYDAEPKVPFEAAEGAEEAPTVDFDQ
ncbi:MAG: LemA family protein, partial [Sphingomonadaceae bacterium]